MCGEIVCHCEHLPGDPLPADATYLFARHHGSIHTRTMNDSNMSSYYKWYSTSRPRSRSGENVVVVQLLHAVHVQDVVLRLGALYFLQVHLPD
jgi:hypothetical protein